MNCNSSAVWLLWAFQHYLSWPKSFPFSPLPYWWSTADTVRCLFPLQHVFAISANKHPLPLSACGPSHTSHFTQPFSAFHPISLSLCGGSAATLSATFTKISSNKFPPSLLGSHFFPGIILLHLPLMSPMANSSSLSAALKLQSRAAQKCQVFP